MTKSWDIERLDQVAEVVGRGIAPKYDDDGDFLVVNQRCIRDGRVSLDNARRHNSGARKVKADKVLNVGDVLVNSTGVGTLGRTAPLREVQFSITADSHVTILRPLPDVSSQWFAYAVSALEPEIEKLAEGSTGQTELSRHRLADLELTVPPLADQRAIAATLGALDDKIESNRRQISSLNRTGRSLYEAAIAENSISVPISTLVEHRPGKHLPKANYRPGSITVYGSNSVMGLHDTPLYEGPFAVMARIGSYCGSLHWTDEPAWVNNNASALLPLNGAPSWILRHALEAIDMSQFRVGTGQPFIAVKALMATALQMPAEGLQGGLNQDLRSISRLGSQRLREIDALQALRDALLPELLSGRIRAADVEITQ